MKNHELGALTGRVALPYSPQQQVEKFLFPLAPPFKAIVDIKRWKSEARRIRAEALSRIYLRGWPREIIRGRPRVVWGETLRPDRSYRVRKLRYEAFPDYWVPALLYEPLHRAGKLPGVLNANGHHEGGIAVNYNQARCANLARRGVLALNFEFIGMGELGGDVHHDGVGWLDVTGLAGVGVFYLAMSKALDVLLAHPRIDKTRVCMTGLSGGGWQTMVLSALDPRITHSVPVAGGTSFRNRVLHRGDLGDWEQLPPDVACVFDCPHMIAMLAPRPALVILNEKDDCCFVTDRTRPVIYDRVRPTYRAFGALDKFEFHSNHHPGTHNYGLDNRCRFYQFLNRNFGLDAPVRDLHRPDEIYSEQKLRVGLPASQTSVSALARQRAHAAAGSLRSPRTPSERRRLRRELARVIRLPDYGTATARKTGRRAGADLMRLGAGPWSLPAVLAADKSVDSTWLFVSDNLGMLSALPPSVRVNGTRVFVDVLGSGAMSMYARNSLLIHAVGQRLLGIQVAQVLAAARWAAKLSRNRRLCLVGSGSTSSLVCLVAAALEPALFRRLVVIAEYSTLAHAVDRGKRYEEAPALFCPDLLRVADIPQMVALLEGVAYVQPYRCVRTERGDGMVEGEGE